VRHSWEASGDDVRLAELVAGGATRDDLTAAFPGHNWNTIECCMRRKALWSEFKANECGPSHGGGTPPILHDHIPPDFGNPPKERLDMMGFLDRAAMRTEGHERKEDTDHKRVVIKTDKPIAVMEAADLHFGGLDVDYAALREHVRFLFDTPAMYWQLVGDSLNLMIMHRVVGARRECMTPDEQIEFGRAMLHESVEKGKLLAVTWGTHDDEFSERSAGFSVTKLLTEGKVPHFRGLGTLELVVGRQTYVIEMTHATRFNSFMNPLHGNKRMLQMHAEFFGKDAPAPDVIVTAHTHSPALSCEGCLPSDRIWLIKTGTFQTNNLYAQRWFGQGRIGVPTLVYHSDRHEAVGFPTPWEAVRYMNGTDWKAKA
jgi:hypothetical protein